MSFSFIKKLTLIGEGGIGISQHPKNVGITDAQLQSGFLSALVSYSKEVHKADLEALTMHDRTLTFINHSPYILIVEFSNAVDKKLMGRILDQMKMEMEPILGQYEGDQIPPENADQMLSKLSSQEWIDTILNNFGLGRPLAGGIIESESFSFYQSKIDTVISKMEEFSEPFMLPLKSEEICLYVVPLNDSYQYIKLPISKETDLFRMAPLLRRELSYLNELDLSPKMIMERLVQMPDLGYKLSQEDEDLISLKFLDDNVKKRLDAAVDAIIKGKSVLVVGEKITTKIVVNTLQIFTQHLHINVNPWLDKDAVDIPQGTTGMAINKYQELLNLNIISNDTVVIDLDNRKVLNGDENKYIQKLIKQYKKKSNQEIMKAVSSELQQIVEDALLLTSYLGKEQEAAKDEFKKMKKDVRDQHKFNLIINLSSQRNPALETLVSGISETLKQAENFLGEF